VEKSYRIDESRFPLVWVTYKAGQTDEEFDELLALYDRLMETRRERYVLVLEAHHSRLTPLPQLKRQAAWMKARAEVMRRQIAGIALVLGSPILRGALKVVLTLQPMPVAHAVCKDAGEAEAWALKRLGRTAAVG